MKRKIPFGYLPSHWGLAGKMREVAQAEYELDGRELAYRLLEINLADLDADAMRKKRLDLQLQYKEITEKEYDIALLTTKYAEDSKEYKLGALDVEKKYKEVTDAEYDKRRASLLEEPYVRVANIKTDPKDPAFGGIILDWNDAFVLYLEEHGYGPNPDPAATVEQWFNAVCKNIALEAFDGVGNFNEQLESNAAKNDVIYRKDLT